VTRWPSLALVGLLILAGCWSDPPPLEGVVPLRDADMVFNGGVARAGIGSVVAGAGDVDGDGWGDVLIAAPRTGFERAGWPGVYLVRGPFSGYEPLYRAELQLTLEDGYEAAGQAVAADLDLNADGFSDFVVGLPGGPGEVRAFYGPLEGELPLSSADARIRGEGMDRIGDALASAGDLDGDGYDDLLVGVPDHVAGGSGWGQGAVYVVHGPVGGSWDLARADGKLTGGGDAFGSTLAPLRGGQGAVQLAIMGGGDGVSVFDGPFVGDRNTNDRVGRVAASAPSIYWPGATVASAGDVDGDGWDDLLVTEPWHEVESVDVGRCLLFAGPVVGELGPEDATWELVGQPEARPVRCVGAGDLDGDGAGDVVIGGRQPGEGARGRSAAWLFYGPLSGQVDIDDADALLTGENEEEETFGASVAPAGDLDRDGVDDLLVGDAAYDGGYWGRGRVYLFHGRGR